MSSISLYPDGFNCGLTVKKLLFICSRNKLRSPTAEEIFRDYPGTETDSAGLADDAEMPLSAEQIEWADVILVMEKVHRSRLNQKFPSELAGKRIGVLTIPDKYGYMDEGLIRLLRVKCKPYLP